MEITVRRLTSQDLTDDSGFYQTLENLTDVRPIEDPQSVLEKIEGQGSVIFVAEANDGQICGTTTLLVEQKFIHQGCVVGHIEDVATRPGYEGNGIGSKVVQAAVDHARTLGCYRIILDCEDSLLGFYNRFGFEKHSNEMRLELKKS